MGIDVDRIREVFPSLHVVDDGNPRVYLDNPGGTQVPQSVIDRTRDYFTTMNANGDGAFVTSRGSDRLLDHAHEAMADFLNAPDPAEIVFGQNMTSLTFSISRSLGRQMKSGDEIILTRMDHDANISPWLMLAEDRGLSIRWLDFDPESCQYQLETLDDLLSDRTRLVAVNYASNAIGTVNDVAEIVRKAHAAGALVFVDAVQFCPHGVTDVQKLGCDVLVCSAYKFFGPHQGILWGRKTLLESLTPYKVRPASNELPGRFETGTLSHEGLAGTLGAIEYIEWIGAEMSPASPQFGRRSDRSNVLAAAMTTIGDYESCLGEVFEQGLRHIPGVKFHGPERGCDRVPTYAVSFEGHRPRVLAEELGKHNIFAWDGHYYAVEVISRLGLDQAGGMLRLGLAHYNSRKEIDRTLNVLSDIVRTKTV